MNLRTHLKSAIMIAILAAIVSACGTVEEKAGKKINQFMEKSGTLGLAVAVVKDGQVIYTGSFGKRSPGDETPLKDGDIFRIASISKSFTTTTLMKLVEEGKVSLDDEVSSLTGFPVQNPQFPETPITVKMLLSHSSSLNDSQGYFTLNTLNPATNPDYAKCYNNYEPGTAYEYCNLGFNTIGPIIEKLSGVRFDQYVREVVILPLNLTASFNVDDLPGATFVPLSHPDTTGFAATGKIGFTISEGVYNSIAARLDTAYIMGYTTPMFSPTGGMKTSARDLARYMIMHMNYGIDPASGIRIISEENSKLMQTPAIPTGDEGGYGLALTRTTNLIKGETMVGHTGSAYGLYSAMYFEPEKKFGIVMMTNGTTPDYATYVNGYAPVQREVVNILYNVFIK